MVGGVYRIVEHGMRWGGPSRALIGEERVGNSRVGGVYDECRGCNIHPIIKAEIGGRGRSYKGMEQTQGKTQTGIAWQGGVGVQVDEVLVRKRDRNDSDYKMG
eukprot:766766-Hanusia_phi.AAC.5